MKPNNGSAPPPPAALGGSGPSLTSSSPGGSLGDSAWQVSGAASSSSTSAWSAWYGRQYGSGGIGGASLENNYVPEGNHMANFYKWWGSNADYRTTMTTFAAAIPGYDPSSRISMENLWQRAGEKSAELAKQGVFMTPLEILSMWSGSKGYSGSGGGSRGYRSTDTSVSYDISDAKTAKQITNAVLTAMLGREATKEELAQYKAALNSYERENPSRSTRTTVSDGSGNSTSSSTSYGGATAAGRQQALQDKAKGTPEEEAFFINDVFSKAMEVLAGRIG